MENKQPYQNWEHDYFEVQKIMGQEIDKLQNELLKAKSRIKKLEAENWQLKHRKRR
ncbi:hypothetical protein [Streptococcus porcinus]|uniref:hypothetical protein n=1 Tax=Streptococcus porcinus TaxID=1340 RepID=UPI001559C9BD|nr:hypothetical protein [Streptococcus porcinus]